MSKDWLKMFILLIFCMTITFAKFPLVKVVGRSYLLKISCVKHFNFLTLSCLTFDNNFYLKMILPNNGREVVSVMIKVSPSIYFPTKFFAGNI